MFVCKVILLLKLLFMTVKRKKSNGAKLKKVISKNASRRSEPADHTPLHAESKITEAWEILERLRAFKKEIDLKDTMAKPLRATLKGLLITQIDNCEKDFQALRKATGESFNSIFFRIKQYPTINQLSAEAQKISDGREKIINLIDARISFLINEDFARDLTESMDLLTQAGDFDLEIVSDGLKEVKRVFESDNSQEFKYALSKYVRDNLSEWLYGIIHGLYALQESKFPKLLLDRDQLLTEYFLTEEDQKRMESEYSVNEVD
jgi:hypothetical protein